MTRSVGMLRPAHRSQVRRSGPMLTLLIRNGGTKTFDADMVKISIVVVSTSLW